MTDAAPDPFHDPAVIAATVDVLAAFAGDGPALELGVGDGRIAIPLAARGVAVHGIDIAPEAIARLRARPGGGELPVTLGDFAAVHVADEGTFSLVYLVYNTIMNLETQAAQVACFRNAARHLRPGGWFVIETMLPALRRLPPGERFVVFDGGPGHWGIDEYDVAVQRLVSHHFDVVDGAATLSSGAFRYVWPAELDLMAALAGLELRHRWSDWTRAPFTDESTAHVSAWARP
ncbi:MAG TPA: class I SAM-dependent methyltransferase [Candidatus Limnocylindrales bacterium]|nr:class I SAM-dependent methyltransferase [Candidatus Limnocylindrales bacterium]